MLTMHNTSGCREIDTLTKATLSTRARIVTIHETLVLALNGSKTRLYGLSLILTYDRKSH